MDKDAIATLVRYAAIVAASAGIGTGGYFTGQETRGSTISAAQVSVVSQFAGKLSECMVKLEEAGGSMQSE